MTKLINIRGTNGSGKSETIRGFLDLSEGLANDGVGGYAPAKIDLHHFEYETKAGKMKPGVVEGYAVPKERVIIVGTYGTQAGGMDKIKTTELCREAIRNAVKIARQLDYTAVLFEGILCSTVFGSWLEFDKEMDGIGAKYHWCFLLPSLKTCLERIQARNGGKPIKEDLVLNKIRSVKSSRTKAIFAGRRVYDLPTAEGFEDGVTDSARAVRAIIDGRGEPYVAR